MNRLIENVNKGVGPFAQLPDFVKINFFTKKIRNTIRVSIQEYHQSVKKIGSNLIWVHTVCMNVDIQTMTISTAFANGLVATQ